MKIDKHVLELLKKRLTRKRLRRVLSHYNYVEKLDGNGNCMQQNGKSPMYDTYCLLNFGYVYPIYWAINEGEIEICDTHEVELAEISITGTDENIIDEALDERQFSGEIFE
tara:strand:+ start:609 stop:941 length:333 start_codon:yes stop_codon:yes gene_type:complete